MTKITEDAMLEIIEKFTREYPEEAEFANKMRIAVLTSTTSDLTSENNATARAYKTTILHDLAQKKFDGASSVITLFKNHLNSPGVKEVAPEIGAIKDRINYLRRTTLKKEDKLSNIAQIAPKLDICISNMTSGEMKPHLDKLSKTVLDTPVEDFPVILAAARIFDQYNAVRIARQSEENANNNAPKPKQIRINSPMLILDQYDTLTNRLKMIDQRVFSRLVETGYTNNGDPYWKCTKCQHLSNNEKSAMKHFADTDNMVCFSEYNKVAFEI